jgi:hypothetical protein
VIAVAMFTWLVTCTPVRVSTSVHEQKTPCNPCHLHGLTWFLSTKDCCTAQHKPARPWVSLQQCSGGVHKHKSPSRHEP